MALPLLPAEHIPTVFESEKSKSSSHEALSLVYEYVENQWISGSMWTPKDWSVYGMPVRTNNDCEGWHHRLNNKSKTSPSFYVLLNILHEEAKLVDTQVKLVSNNKLKKNQRKAKRAMEGKVFEVWGEYSLGDMSASKLLKKLSRVYCK